MFGHKTLAWALACALVGGAAAAQELRYPDPAERPTAVPAAAAKKAPAIALVSEALGPDEIKVSWSAIPNDEGVTMEVRVGSEDWLDVGPVRLGPACQGCSGAVYVVGVIPGETYWFRLRREGRPISNETAATAFYDVPPPCEGEGALCLHGRFRIDASYDGGRGIAGKARAVRLTPESGYFWFFAPSNIEVVVKMLDGCSVNDKKWVFLTGLTSLRVLAVVTDTSTGATSTYLSANGEPFPTIQDVSAFSSCS